jgi:hypothetical protein
MDEHIGLTSKVSAAVLGKSSLSSLLLSPQAAVAAGTAQRVHNALVQHPQVLVRDKRVQLNVFQALEALLTRAVLKERTNTIANNNNNKDNTKPTLTPATTSASVPVSAPAPLSPSPSSSSASSTAASSSSSSSSSSWLVWDAAAWKALSSSSSCDHGSASDAGPVAAASMMMARLYILAMLLQLFFLHPQRTSFFSTKQLQHIETWKGQILARLAAAAAAASPLPPHGNDGGDHAAEINEQALLLAPVLAHLQRVRADFAALNPFAHLQLAPFTVPGLSRKQLQTHSESSGNSSSSSSRTGGGGSTVAKKKTAVVDAATAAAVADPPAAVATAVDDVPFTFLPRRACPSCGRLQPFYCTHCLRVVHPLAVGRLPQVDLGPSLLHIDLLLHANVARHKSTALQLLLLLSPPSGEGGEEQQQQPQQQQRSVVTEHVFPGSPLPPQSLWDAQSTAVVFPSSRALTMKQVAAHLRAQKHVAASIAPSSSAQATATATAAATATTTAEAATSFSPASPSSSPSSSVPAACTLTSLRRLVFLEGTWGEAEAMLAHHPRLRDLTHVRLDFDCDIDESAVDSDATPAMVTTKQQAGPSGTAGPAATTTTATAAPTTAFWRFQRFGASFLSSIEAVYHTLRQMDQHGLMSVSNSAAVLPAPSPTSSPSSPSSSSSSSCSSGSSSSRFDNVLWLFAMAYERVRTHYASQPMLLPPVQMTD